MNISLLFSILLLLFLGDSPEAARAATDQWRQIAKGLAVVEMQIPQKASVGDSRITVIRIDTAFYSFDVFCAAASDSVNRTVREWCEEFGLTAAVNAGMYAKDYRTHVGYLRKDSLLLGLGFRKDYKSVLASRPLRAGLPSVRLIDLECESFDNITTAYGTVLQNLRMISCHRRNVWQQQNRRWSTVALGEDNDGHLLFILCRSPYSVHDLNNILLALPLGIKKAMYLEGGAPASLYLSAGSTVMERYGIYDGAGSREEGLEIIHRLPNVIGIKRRK
jgi:hypothetical protein